MTKDVRDVEGRRSRAEAIMHVKAVVVWPIRTVALTSVRGMLWEEPSRAVPAESEYKGARGAGIVDRTA